MNCNCVYPIPMKKPSNKARRPAPSTLARGQGPIRPATSLPVVYPHAGGIDVGASELYVCVPEDAVSPGQSPVRRFGVFTGELDKLVEWLQSCGVKTVAMESTGTIGFRFTRNWKPVGWKWSWPMRGICARYPVAKLTSKTANGFSDCIVRGCCRAPFVRRRSIAPCAA